MAGAAVVGLIILVGCEQWGQRQQNGERQPDGNGMMGPDTADTNGMGNDTGMMNDTGDGWMNGDTGSYQGMGAGNGGMDTARQNGGMNGMGEKMSGTVAEVNPMDSTVVIVDTVKIRRDTEITTNGGKATLNSLSRGSKVSVEYETRNGEKVATEITGEPDTTDRRQMDQQQRMR
jgi:hypothetical protein